MHRVRNRTFWVLAALIAAAPRGAGAQVVINEVLASNRLGLEDEDGDAPDWLELRNLGTSPVDLEGWSLSDDGGVPRKWVFPRVSLPEDGLLLVWCSGKDRAAIAPEDIEKPGSPLVFSPTWLSPDSEWRYLTGAPEDPGPPPTWNRPEHDDSGWLAGRPGFGFGETYLTTILPEGIGAAFFRGAFEVSDPSAGANLVLRVKYDDGFVAWLNGQRVASANFPEDAEPSFASVSTRATESRTEKRIDLTAARSLLLPGRNVLAIALVNRSPADGDLAIIPDLGTVLPPLHSSFELDAGGESIWLHDDAGLLRNAVTLPRQYEDQSWGRSPEDPSRLVYLLEPTPGTPNRGPSSETPLVVSDTKFAPDRGFHEEPFLLSISTETPGAEIRYTVDGSVPTESQGLVYSGPIPISKTTVVRAIAHAAGMKPTDVDTHTYLFLEDVIRQDSRATIAAGFPATWGGTPPDYGMDGRVIGQDGADQYGGKYAATIRDDLRSLPTLALSLPIADLFGPSGIYTNSQNRGVLWERAASAELILPDGSTGFQVNAGLRMQGGAFRSHGLTKKHSFRLLFKRAHGPAKLRYRLFDDPGATASFDTLTVRANANDGWQWDVAAGNALYVRDSFCRETALDMGAVASHEVFVHLYLDGFYWGLYDIVERPDAAFSATYFGGRKEEWDAVTQNGVSDGDARAWNAFLTLAGRGFATAAAYQAALGNGPDGTDDPALERYLDPPNLIDYMIVNLYGGNGDWPHNNWWVGRRRVESTGFKFYMWDAEWTLGLQSDVNTNQTGVSSGVAAPYNAARANPEFRMAFADRLQRCLLGPGGALYVDPRNPAWDPLRPERNAPAARFQRLAGTVERAIVAESARWGDQHAPSRPYTRDEHWRPARDALLRSYFPQRSAVVLQQFRTAKLYPSIDPPAFNAPGGTVPVGFPVGVRAAVGVVYWTTDGSDPRLPGGAVSPAARTVAAPEETALLPTGAAARFLVPADDSLGLSWTALDFDDSGWMSGPTGLGFETGTGVEGEVATDVESILYDKSATLYVRLPFEVPDPSGVVFLDLAVKYDDGFVAYLNGSRIAERNAPSPPAWNGQATRGRADAQAVAFERVDVSEATRLLRAGANVLAIHGLNLRARDGDFLLVPELRAIPLPPDGFSVAESTLVRARALSGTEWSAIVEASFEIDAPPRLVISEVMYHPEDPPPGSPYDAEDHEYIELRNIGGSAIRLAGIRMLGGVTIAFAADDETVVPPGGHAVLVEDPGAFRSRYGDRSILVAGRYTGKLSNSGDSFALLDSRGRVFAQMAYDDAWYPATDGEGFSLVLRDDGRPPASWNVPEAWASSARRGGSPGAREPAPEDGGWQLQGDANQDGRRNVSDAVVLLSHLFGGSVRPLACGGPTLEGGGTRTLHDLNGDGTVDLADPIRLLAWVFRQGPPPALGAECLRIAGCPDACAPR